MKREMSVEEARAALRDLEQTRIRSRNSIFAQFAAIPLMLWGLIWAFCHLNGALYLVRGSGVFGLSPDRIAQWVSLSGLAITAVFCIVKFRYSNPLRSQGSWCFRYRAPLLVVAWFIFYAVLSRLHTFESGMQRNAYDAVFWMILFMVFGFWFPNGHFLAIGALVSGWAIIAYHFFPEYYHVFMGLGGGGTLFFGGLHVWLGSRRIKPEPEEDPGEG